MWPSHTHTLKIHIIKLLKFVFIQVVVEVVTVYCYSSVVFHINLEKIFCATSVQHYVDT